MFLCAVPSVKGVSHTKLGMIRMFTVVGNGGATAPKADAVITAETKRYVVPPLHAGLQTIELRNRSGSGRGFELYTLNPGKTQKDLDLWFKTIETTGKQPAGRLPQTILGAMQTIPTGTSVYLTLRLDVGRSYRLFDDDSGIKATFTPR